jgi:hypothetical protein
MGRTNQGVYQPGCMLAHDVINRLSVIVGYCDLLADETPEGSDCRKRLLTIRNLAKVAAADLTEHQCQLETLVRDGTDQGMTAPQKT